MRFAIGGLMHETNTFTELMTPLEDFLIAEGEEMLSIPESVRDMPIQGIIEVCQAEKVEIVPTLFGQALPSGTICRDAYLELKRRILDRIVADGELDAVVLSMHGSMYVEEIGDADGDLLEAVRQAAPNVPIICALDLHATLTQKMMDNADAFVGFRTAPPVDKVETGHKAAWLAIKTVQENLQLAMDSVRIPMIISGEQSETTVPPTSDIIAELVHLPEEGDLLSSSIFLGFPWADVPYSCVSSLAVTTTDKDELAHQEARRLAELIWENRNEFKFTTEAYLFEECLDIAEREKARPVVIADCGDNPTAGSSEDLTVVVDVLIKRQFKSALVAVIVDPSSYERCVNAGVGSTTQLQLGRVNPDEPKPIPLEVEAQVKHIGAGKGIPSAVIGIGEVDVVISTKRTDVYDPQFLLDLNLQPSSYQAIVVKSGYLSPEYQALTHRPLLALPPGDTNPLLETVPYKQVVRPIYPLDKDFDWSPN